METTQIVIARFTHILSRFCVTFGRSFAHDVMLPLLMEEVRGGREGEREREGIGLTSLLSLSPFLYFSLSFSQIARSNFISPPSDGESRRHRLLPALLVGVYPTLPQEEMKEKMKELIECVALQEEGWGSGSLTCLRR